MSRARWQEKKKHKIFMLFLHRMPLKFYFRENHLQIIRERRDQERNAVGRWGYALFLFQRFVDYHSERKWKEISIWISFSSSLKLLWYNIIFLIEKPVLEKQSGLYEISFVDGLTDTHSSSIETANQDRKREKGKERHTRLYPRLYIRFQEWWGHLFFSPVLTVKTVLLWNHLLNIRA